MLHVESDGQIVECVLCLFSVLDGVSQSLSLLSSAQIRLGSLELPQRPLLTFVSCVRDSQRFFSDRF